MALEPGTRFGNYAIDESIGAGGMGEVYRATDTTLERDVAIKVLPPSFADDAERVTRFEREAKTLASLNHPNIAQIFGLEKSDGTTALVMELVEGPTLEDRIAQGPLPADKALGIAMQIADALEAAHGQSIIHRDLKPANIKIRPDGTVKVLDFGIAKALAPENLTSGPQSPIMTTPATQVGVILGTAAYMSPEQAKGKAVDQRTDIWAFGCLLYEMLTGQLAFGAEDVPTTLARIIANDTNLDSLPAAVSPAARRTIELCLQKDPAKRVADIRDVKLALAGTFETVPSQATGAPGPPPPRWRRSLPALSALLVGGVVAGLGVWIGTQPGSPPVNRFAHELPQTQTFRNTGRPVVALSPDGRHFVYNTSDGVYLRTMGELEARLIPGTEPGLISPTFSPDSQSIAYWSIEERQLKRIAISGGAPVVIAGDAEAVFGLSWATDGTILFGQADGIYRVSANGGRAELAVLAPEGFAYGPSLLPDGQTVLFNVGGSSWDTASIVAESLLDGERTVLVEGGSDARYLPTGHLVYALGDGLFGIAFDASTLTTAGGPVPLVQGVMRANAGQTGVANYGVSDDGTLVYVSGTVTSGANTLVWVDREGAEQPINVSDRAYTYPRISPDGTKVAIDVRDQELDVWTFDFARQTLDRLTVDPGEDEFPIWSPDGRRIAYSSSRSGGNTNVAVHWRPADGTGSEERLAESDGQIFPGAFLPDGTGMLVHGDFTGANANDDIAILPLDGEGRVTPVLATAFAEVNPNLSSDGRWLAYSSNETGNNEIYVRPFPDIDAGRWPVSTNGGVQPVWARDGRELFFRNGRAVIAVTIETEPGFRAGTPEVLFEGNYVLGPGGRTYDVSPEGDRFLMIKPAGDDSAQPNFVIVQNWFEELERLVPTN